MACCSAGNLPASLSARTMRASFSEWRQRFRSCRPIILLRWLAASARRPKPQVARAAQHFLERTTNKCNYHIESREANQKPRPIQLAARISASPRRKSREFVTCHRVFCEECQPSHFEFESCIARMAPRTRNPALRPRSPSRLDYVKSRKHGPKSYRTPLPLPLRLSSPHRNMAVLCAPMPSRRKLRTWT